MTKAEESLREEIITAVIKMTTEELEAVLKAISLIEAQGDKEK